MEVVTHERVVAHADPDGEVGHRVDRLDEVVEDVGAEPGPGGEAEERRNCW